MVQTSILPSAEAFSDPSGWLAILQAAAFLALAVFLLGAVLRLIFGKGTPLNCAISASLSVMLIYLAVILIEVFFPQLRGSLPPFPFVKVDPYRLFLADVLHISSDALYPAVLRLGVLALTVNLLEEFMPRGEKLLSWYLWRCVTVLTALGAYVFICGLADRFLPHFFGSWAKWIIWGLWSLILLTGLLKLLLGLVLTAMNPIVGALYALFFSHPVGKQFSKSILTTLLVMLTFALLYRGGLTQFAFSDFSLAAYGPSCILILVSLYLFGKFL